MRGGVLPRPDRDRRTQTIVDRGGPARVVVVNQQGGNALAPLVTTEEQVTEDGQLFRTYPRGQGWSPHNVGEGLWIRHGGKSYYYLQNYWLPDGYPEYPEPGTSSEAPTAEYTQADHGTHQRFTGVTRAFRSFAATLSANFHMKFSNSGDGIGYLMGIYDAGAGARNEAVAPGESVSVWAEQANTQPRVILRERTWVGTPSPIVTLEITETPLILTDQMLADYDQLTYTPNGGGVVRTDQLQATGNKILLQNLGAQPWSVQHPGGPTAINQGETRRLETTQAGVRLV